MIWLAYAMAKIDGWFNKVGDQNRGMFDHAADGEPCAHCGKPMRTRQGITRVGNGDMMHSWCWTPYFKNQARRIAERYRGGQ